MGDRSVYRVGMWWTWPHGNGSEANSVEVYATSEDEAVVEALSQVSGGRIGRSTAAQTPEITSVEWVRPAGTTTEGGRDE